VVSKNTYIFPFIVLSIGIVLILSWVFEFSTLVNNDYDETRLTSYVGKFFIVDKLGDATMQYIPISVDYTQQVLPFNSTLLRVNSDFVDYNAATHEKLWESKKTNFIYKDTGKYVNLDNAYLRFPLNTQKQNYNVYLYSSGDPQPFVFEETSLLDGMKVYKFSCKLTGDLSSSYPQFKPDVILSDYSCNAWIEPTTGDEIFYTENWHDYTIKNNTKITISMGESRTSEFAKQLQIMAAKHELNTIYLSNVVIPTVLFFVLIGLVSSLVLYQKQKQKIIEAKLQHEKDEKLTTIGLVASRLAHDIRNPLSVIKNAIVLIGLENQNEKSKDRFVMIDRAISRITHQIDDVMDFVRNKPLNISEIDISVIINKTLKLLQVPPGISIDVETHEIKLQCDSKQLEVVFNNLITNAIESLGEKGTIKIRVKEIGNMVYVSIEDSGPGVPSDVMEKIFEPLFTTKQTGTGLGLVSCKNIVEQHGGNIVVSNNPSTFTIILPKKYHEDKI
jgi:signal transduction histidine kinase